MTEHRGSVTCEYPRAMGGGRRRNSLLEVVGNRIRFSTPDENGNAQVRVTDLKQLLNDW